MFHALQPLILASGSPRRHELLSSVGIPYTVRVPAGEEKPRPGEAPADYALRAARGKALGVFSDMGKAARQSAILAADTIVVLNGRILGKPGDNDEALMMIRALAGAKHTVITACCLLVGGLEDSFYVESTVHMWQAPDELLAAYAATEEPLDKAGGYAIQGPIGFLIRAIHGSWSGVVGLPLAEVVQKLLIHRVVLPANV